MQDNIFNNDFIRQFRQECMVYAGFDEKQYQDLLFRQFAGTEREISFLVKFLAVEMSDAEISKCLFLKLSKKDIPAYNRLACFIKKLQIVLGSYAQGESYTSHYYQPLLVALKQILVLVNSVQEKIQKSLLDKLEIPGVNKTQSDNTGYFSIEDLDDIRAEVGRYVDQFHEHFDHFNLLLQRESKNSHGIILTTQVEQYLLKLIMLIEKIIIANDITQTILEKWHTLLINLETQEIYN